MQIAEVALPTPLRRNFDYLVPQQLEATIAANRRVLVPFGKRQLVGIVVDVKANSEFEPAKLKPVAELINQQSLLPEDLFRLLIWAANYYHYSWGEVFHHAIPTLLRKGRLAELPSVDVVTLTDQGRSTGTASLKSAKRQQQALTLLQERLILPVGELKASHNISKASITGLEEKGLVVLTQQALTVDHSWQDRCDVVKQQKPVLSADQAIAVSCITQASDFQSFLLEGVTGSGKTEVYLQAIEPVIAAGKQVLILVPEIGLTPQTIERFEKRFDTPIQVLHSGLTENERLNGWLQAKLGGVSIVIGTRSAIFTPFQQLAMIVVDEEHDTSFKQQDSFRYHARDLAVMRAQKENIPLVLGTATPSLESLHNALQNKYQHLMLNSRAGGAQLPSYQLLDMKYQNAEQGLAQPLQSLMEQHLQAGNQVLLFLNRRGFAPIVMCHDCGWVAECQRCEVSYTVHKSRGSLQCHHCQGFKRLPHACPDCGSCELHDVGIGTEKLQHQVERLFPQYSCIRIDSDNTSRKGTLEQYLTEVGEGKHQILIGTQMLAKGHHFPNVTLVAMVDVDSALYSQDFRAPERFAQMYTQVSGRAGRGNKHGVVALQTHHPDHELLQDLINNGYGHFARYALRERKQYLLPPFSFQALFRAEAMSVKDASQFLQQVKECIAHNGPRLALFGPMTAPLEKKAGKYRFQLLLQSETRQDLHRVIGQSIVAIEKIKLASKVRWSLDIDPSDSY